MSRLPRAHEYLKTGFTAEAAAAARFRASAARAERDGQPNLARAWRELATAKDELARVQLEASGQLRADTQELSAALAEERYENDSLYPRMMREVDGETAKIFASVVAKQQEHLARLESLLDALTRSPGDLPG